MNSISKQARRAVLAAALLLPSLCMPNGAIAPVKHTHGAITTVADFDATTWTQLLKTGPRPAAYVFTNRFCATCPEAFDTLQKSVVASGKTVPLAAILMDVQGERALAHGMSLRGVLDLAREFRRTDTKTPLVLMGYLNPIESMGHDAFVANARDAGVDGVLTVDLPPEEAAEFASALDSNGIAPIFLLAPTTSEQRIQQIARMARGYLYYVSLKGVTGSATLNVGEVADKLAIIRAHTDLPLGVGFGIKDPPTAAAIAAVADAVVVGSALEPRRRLIGGLGDFLCPPECPIRRRG